MLVSNAGAAIKRASAAADTVSTTTAQKTGPLRARFGDRQRGGAGDHLPREELLAGMHHLLPTGIAVRHKYAKLGTEAQRNHRHASHALGSNFIGVDLTFAIRLAANSGSECRIQSFFVSMTFSENRCPLFGIML
jgi:hypothetical protein